MPRGALRPRATVASGGLLSEITAKPSGLDVVVDSSVTHSWVRPDSGSTPAPQPLTEAARGSDFRSKYELLGEVGRGSMGRVLLAFDRDLKRQVAMKVLTTTGDNARILRRFVEEAQISGQLEHPNLLPVHDVGVTDEGDYFFTMKHVASHKTLRTIIKGLQRGDEELHERYPFERRVEIGRALCLALAHAHDRGVVHRDVKPTNVMIDEEGGVYLLDWGIARLRHELNERAREERQIAEGLIPVGAGTAYLVGTPVYMAPEQARAQAADGRADLYSAAALLYEFLTLHHYLEGARVLKRDQPKPAEVEEKRTQSMEEDPTQKTGPTPKIVKLLNAVQTYVPKDAESYYDSLNGRTPRVVSRILRKALAKDPAERYQSAREFEQALRDWEDGCGPVVCPGTALQSSMSSYSRWIDRHPLLVPLLTFVLGGLFLISYGVLVYRSL